MIGASRLSKNYPRHYITDQARQLRTLLDSGGTSKVMPCIVSTSRCKKPRVGAPGFTPTCKSQIVRENTGSLAFSILFHLNTRPDFRAEVSGLNEVLISRRPVFQFYEPRKHSTTIIVCQERSRHTLLDRQRQSRLLDQSRILPARPEYRRSWNR